MIYYKYLILIVFFFLTLQNLITTDDVFLKYTLGGHK